MAFLIFLIGLTCFGLVLAYMHAFFSLYGIIKAEKPEWLQVRGSLSFMYDGLPRAGDPNVMQEVLRVAFTTKASELQSSMAIIYAKRIRVLLPAFIVLFAGLITYLALADSH